MIIVRLQRHLQADMEDAVMVLIIRRQSLYLQEGIWKKNI